MVNLISSLQDTAVYLNKQEENIVSTINALSENEDKLRSYIIFYMLASKSKDALNKIKDEVPNIERRFFQEIENVCKEAEELLSGLKKHIDCVKDIMNALDNMCMGTDLVTRNTELNNQIEDMEKSLRILIEKRNNIPIDQLIQNT